MNELVQNVAVKQDIDVEVYNLWCMETLTIIPQSVKLCSVIKGSNAGRKLYSELKSDVSSGPFHLHPMECQASDNKKLFKVFDASRRKTSKKKGYDETNSVATDESNADGQASVGRVASAKASLQQLSAGQGDLQLEAGTSKRDRDSSPSVSRSPASGVRVTRSPRHHRRHVREGISLALKPGHVSTPRSTSPPQDVDAMAENAVQGQDSLIYAFLEDAIKRDKRKQRHARRREECRAGRDPERGASPSYDRQHRHRRRNDDDPVVPRGRDKPLKDRSPTPVVDQTLLFQTFASFCAQMAQKNTHCKEDKEVPRTQSHKSLQCEVLSDVEQRPVRLHRELSYENLQSARVRSHNNLNDSRARLRSPERTLPHAPIGRRDKYPCSPPYETTAHNYTSKFDLVGQRPREEDRYRDYRTEAVPARSCIDHGFRPRGPPDRKDLDDCMELRGRYEDDLRRHFEQKTSRSFDVHREAYPDDDRGCRRTSRSDSHKKRYEEQKSVRRFDERKEKYYEERDCRERQFSNLPSKDRRSRRNLERLERTSVASRDEEYRCSERGRDSAHSVADETSTLSGRTNYLRLVKQEIAEQRDSMDKMMKLWKELMRCFKGISSTQQDKAVHESAATVQESAAAQLRLWRECMRRYETVARDVGDTDARLMEEITKQRSEMSEMAGMWQECLQRYRDMSTDFNTLKQQLATSESPARAPAPPQCTEGETAAPPAHYRMPPPLYPPMGAGYSCGSPLRSRASAPPAWWWRGEPPSPRRRSSPDSRASRDRGHTRRHKERDDSRYKEKSSKSNAARSEHRHRKR